MNRYSRAYFVDRVFINSTFRAERQITGTIFLQGCAFRGAGNPAALGIFAELNPTQTHAEAPSLMPPQTEARVLGSSLPAVLANEE
jgi:hypothetical protein